MAEMLACEKCEFYTFLVTGTGDMAFCPTDGSPLVLKEPPACGSCGRAYGPRLRGTFCTECGVKLT